MTDSLISKFQEMTDREILIATCLKVEQIEGRIDKHSAQSEIERQAYERHRAEDLKTFQQLSEEQRQHKAELETLRTERKTERRTARDIFAYVSAFVGMVGGLLGIVSKFFKHT